MPTSDVAVKDNGKGKPPREQMQETAPTPGVGGSTPSCPSGSKGCRSPVTAVCPPLSSSRLGVLADVAPSLSQHCG